jgi:hypothetical protein
LLITTSKKRHRKRLAPSQVAQLVAAKPECSAAPLAANDRANQFSGNAKPLAAPLAKKFPVEHSIASSTESSVEFRRSIQAGLNPNPLTSRLPLARFNERPAEAIRGLTKVTPLGRT